MRKFGIKDVIAITLLIAFIGTGSYLWLSPTGLQPAPELEVTVLTTGDKISLRDLRGHPVLVTFWSTSCPGCIKEIPHLAELYKELGPRGLEVIGIAIADDRPDYVLEMHKRKQIPYPIAWDGQGIASRAFGTVSLTPTSFLINPQGQIVQQKIGELDMKLVHARILSMLQNPGV